MSTDALQDVDAPEGAPELTPLGKRLEILRIERGVSKQRLARHAGTSRQQLWRVMTGKSELTSSLRERLATALAVESAVITGRPATATTPSVSAVVQITHGEPDASSLGIADYLTEPAHLVRTLRTLPAGDSGRRLKRSLLNAIEDLAVDSGFALPFDYSDIRRRVLAGEL
jgi:transcriptional regulator with XRE-family HTH domain